MIRVGTLGAVEDLGPVAAREGLPPEAFVNRELSWLEFNRRVLEEAQDETVPLLERVKFLAIFSSNLDEFFMVRVAMLKRRIQPAIQTAEPRRAHPRTTLTAVSERVHELVAGQRRCFRTTSGRSWPRRASGSPARRRSAPSRGASSTTTSGAPCSRC